jgi:inosine-uridine nucleoside N-ribohydrolase
MGGNFSETGPEAGRIEFNVAGDLMASEIVYKAPVKLHRSLGLNVTQQVMMSSDDVRRRFTMPILRPVLDMAEIWFEEFYPFITFHDPLAAATIFEPDLCSWQPGTTESPHQVAMTVDVDRYFEHFFHVLGSE